MKIENFTDSELQKMRLAIKGVSRLAMYFEGTVSENTNYIMNVTVAPVTYVYSMDNDHLIFMVLTYGYEKAAQKLSVSISFLKKEVKNRMKNGVSFKINFKFNDVMTEDEVMEMAKRVPFVNLLRILSGWSINELRRKINFKRFFLDSNLSTSRGRKAELVYKSFRGMAILRDLNEDQAQSIYDFDDKKYGRVNVKSARLVITKTKGRKWYFNLLNNDKCDFYALVCFNEIGDLVLRIIMIPMIMLKGKSVIIGEDEVCGIGEEVWRV